MALAIVKCDYSPATVVRFDLGFGQAGLGVIAAQIDVGT